jgi:hypothetical protein
MNGTDPRRCRSHLGRKAEVVKAEFAARVRGEQIRATYDLDAHSDPLTELLRLAEEVLAWKNICAAMVGQLTEIRYKATGSGEQLRAEIRLYESSMDRAARVLTDLVRLGIEDRLSRIDEARQERMIQVLDRIFDRLELSAAQRVLIGTVVPQEFRAAAAQEFRAAAAQEFRAAAAEPHR